MRLPALPAFALPALLILSTPAVAQDQPSLDCPAEQSPEGTSRWRIVRTEGFSFCVPTDWRPDVQAGPAAGQVRWSAGVASVEGGRGRPRREVRTETRMVSGEELQRLQEEARAIRTSRSTEVVQEQRIQLTTVRNTRTGQTTITAEWGGPSRGHLLMLDETGAQLRTLMQIVRTIRPATEAGS